MTPKGYTAVLPKTAAHLDGGVQRLALNDEIVLTTKGNILSGHPGTDILLQKINSALNAQAGTVDGEIPVTGVAPFSLAELVVVCFALSVLMGY